MQAAKIAVEMGAIDFITSGDADALKAKKGFLLNPFDVEIDNEMSEMVPGMSKYTEEEEPLKWIEDACGEWRAGRVKPHWVTYNDSKNKKSKLVGPPISNPQYSHCCLRTRCRLADIAERPCIPFLFGGSRIHISKASQSCLRSLRGEGGSHRFYQVRKWADTTS